MKKSFCYGFIIFRKTVDSDYEFLLIKSAKGHYDFPKGHKDHTDNSKLETAKRETFEETGIKNPKINIEFSVAMDWIVDRESENPVHKFVEMFLAEVEFNTKVTLSSEHTEYRWCDLESALDLLEFENFKSSLLAAFNYLKFTS